MKILFVSSLYPSSVEPGMAPYNRQLLAALAQRASVRVLAPVLTFPGLMRLRGRRLPPEHEILQGISVSHPRVWYTPGVLVPEHWRMVHHGIAKPLSRCLEEFQPDSVIASFLYPDAAAVLPHCLAKNIPCAVMVLGSDFRIRARQARFRETVMHTLASAPTILCPGQALKRDMIAAGVDAAKIVAFDNGVDHALFRQRPRTEALDRLWDQGGTVTADAVARIRTGARCVLFAGHLEHVKGPDRMLAAFALLQATNAILVLAGGGKRRSSLKRDAMRARIADRVYFLGNRPHDQIADWMHVADCLCLPSRSEGMPNVVVEALASGLPVVATDVGEVPYLVKDGVNGFVVSQGNDDGTTVKLLAEGIESALGREWDRAAIARGVAEMTWDKAAEVMLGKS